MDSPTFPTADGFPAADDFGSTKLIGTVLGQRYAVVQELGRGGMGATYLAHDNKLHHRPVVVKILLTRFENAQYVEKKFHQEAEALARVDHPNIINILDTGTTPAGYPYLVMEYAKGGTLRSRICDGGMEFSLVAHIMRQLGSALNAAHEVGILHRDLKPENIIVIEHNELSVKIIDFGIAAVKNSTIDASTIAGGVGTPSYAAPEQMMGQRVSSATDVYSLGVTAFEMLTGKRPFQPRTIVELYELQRSSDFVTPRKLRRDLPRAAETIILRAIAFHPRDRYSNALDFCNSLADALVEDSTRTYTTESIPDTAKSIRRYILPIRGLSYWLLGLLKRVSLAWTKTFDVEETQLRVEKGTIIQRVLPPSNTEIKLSEHLTVHLSPSESGADISSTVILRIPEVLGRSGDHVFEELILHKDYERLWRAVMYAGGGNYLFTGYGPFGGTSLVRCAIAKARDELLRVEKRSSTLLVFYFHITEETKESFKVEASSFCFGHLPAFEKHENNSNLAELRKRVHLKQENSLIDILPLERPLGVTFFKTPESEAKLSESPSISDVRDKRPDRSQESSSRIWNKGKGRPAKKEAVYGFSEFVADLNNFFKNQQNGEALHNIVLRLVASDSLPSRVVIIIDKIKFLETLESLSMSSLFNNKQIMVLVLTRKEDFDSWENTVEELKRLEFSKWYVPCVWNIGDWGQRLFSDETETTKKTTKTLLRYLEYRGRGSIGNILKELRHPELMHYGESKSFIDPTTLTSRIDILSIAWLQGLLEVNWEFLLDGIGLIKQEAIDRARLGIYGTLDWITEKSSFTNQELTEACCKFPITISDEKEIREKTTEKILRVLAENDYIQLKANRYYVVWNRNNQKEYRSLDSKSVDKQTKRTRRTHKQQLGEKSKTVSAINSGAIGPESLLASSKSETNESQGLESPPAIEISSKDLNNKSDSEAKSKIAQEKAAPQIGERVFTSVLETDREVIKTKTYITPKENPMGKKINILMVLANPKGSDPLRLADEDRTIRECIKRSKHRDLLNEVIIHAARPMDFQRKLLEDEYEVIHFSGHGTPSGQLAFEDEVGQIKLIPREAIASLLSKFPSVKCVILNACYSVNKGHLTAIGDLCTIAMEGPISDEAAQIFTRGFYDALGAGKDYQFSYEMGCEAIKMEGLLMEANTPKFLGKSSSSSS